MRLAIWFQAIKGVSAVKSGIMNIPMILSLVIISIVGGIAVTIIGYYTPFVYASTILMSIGAGLLSTFETDTGSPKWIGYQVIFGAGVGFGMQQAIIMAQTVLPNKDIPIGTAMMMFCQTLGGAVSLVVANVIFSTTLWAEIPKHAPDVVPETVIAAGASAVRDVVTSTAALAGTLQAYAISVDRVSYLTVGLSGVCFVSAWGMGWKDIRTKNV